MRLKSYTAPSMAEAMAMVRQELGDEAIIVSTQRAVGGKGVRITAALEPEDGDDGGGDGAIRAGGPALAEAVRAALESHGTPIRLIERLSNTAGGTGLDDHTLACAAALEDCFAFAPLPDVAAPRPFMLIGPPGAGKTMTVAKLAARGVMKRRRVAVVTADNYRAGAIEQLSAFTRILAIDLKSARTAEALRQQVEAASGADLVFIDSPGLNPFKTTDMEFLSELIQAADVEPILVMAAGGDPNEAAEIADSFGAIGATRLLATRLDMTRRLGAILAAADAAQLMLCDVSANPHVAGGLVPISPATLARLIMPSPEPTPAPKEEPQWTEASP